MNETSHTPGPWEWSGRTHPAEIGIINPARDHMLVIALLTSGNVENQSADARLIAAAPDLLEALEAYVGWAERVELRAETVYIKACAAILKAKGAVRP